jgi:hypothetical protein
MMQRLRIAPRLVTVGLLIAGTAAAAAPDSKTIVAKLKQAVEPPRPSARKMELTVAQDGATSTLVLGQARGAVAGGNRILTVVLAPPDLRGTAYLVQEMPASDADKLWVWLPAVGRVRTVTSPEAFSAVLNSDFTYADLGFVRLRSTYSMMGEATVNGVHVYRIANVPAQRWYYARIETSVASDSFLPVERVFFDGANQRWKVERFEGVAVIDGVPTVLSDAMDDLQSKSRSTIKITDLRYGLDVPESLLQPAGLPQAVAAPLWTAIVAPVGK